MDTSVFFTHYFKINIIFASHLTFKIYDVSHKQSPMFKIDLFKDFFFFSKGERQGLLLLSGLILMMFAINFCLPQQDGHAESYLRQADSLLTQTEDSALLKKPRYPQRHSYKESDPSEKTEEKRPYAPPKRTYSQQTDRSSHVNARNVHNEYESLRIELNSADTTELKKLRGIGSKLSQRIVKYRTKLGGFSSKEQLKAVYGLSEETYEAILPHIWVDSTAIQ